METLEVAQVNTSTRVPQNFGLFVYIDEKCSLSAIELIECGHSYQHYIGSVTVNLHLGEFKWCKKNQWFFSS